MSTTTPSPSIPLITLNTSAPMPAFGLGTWQAPAADVTAAVTTALRLGYRHLDCATIYGNEAAVGAGIRASGVPRAELFLTSKLWNTSHHPDDVPAALDETLQKLGTEYLDLWLMHYPGAHAATAEGGMRVRDDVPFTATWAAMEACVAAGKARAIGISNFCASELATLLDSAKVVPAVHQMELHPYLPQVDFLALHKQHGIHVTAYSPFGNANFPGAAEVPTFEHPAVVEVARRTGRTPAQVCIGWALGRGTSVIPKSVREERLRENLEGARLSPLGEGDMAVLDAVQERARYADFGKVQGYWCYRDLECPGYNPAEGR